jgi:hypothetical protein
MHQQRSPHATGERQRAPAPLRLRFGQRELPGIARQSVRDAERAGIEGDIRLNQGNRQITPRHDMLDTCLQSTLAAAMTTT